jgi:hypothetical protein
MTKYSLRVGVLLNQLRESNYKNHDVVDEFVRLFWTQHELWRQLNATDILRSVSSDTGKKRNAIDLIFETMLFNFPPTFTGFFEGDHCKIYNHFRNSDGKLSADEIKSRVDKILARPIPPYAGIGNVYIGFYLPLRKWSVSEQQVRLTNVFDGNVIFEDKTGKELTIPLKNLPQSEQKYINELIDFPKTGKFPTTKNE